MKLFLLISLVFIALLLSLGGCNYNKTPVSGSNRITEEQLFDIEDQERMKAKRMGIRFVDYLHLVNTNKINR